MKLVSSFGSCLSANIAYNLTNIYSEWCRISSVQHNRIDQFNEIYLTKKHPQLSISDLKFELSDTFSYVNTIDNQLNGVGLGKALPRKEDKLPLINFFDAVNFGKIDLFIFDNFAELLFKVYKHKLLGTPMFINEKYLTSKASEFEFINSFISGECLVDSYDSVFTYLTLKNPKTKIAFIPFPINLKNDINLTKRSHSYHSLISSLKSKHKNLYILPNIEIKESDLANEKDIYHFNDKCYFNYSRSVLKTII
ncbi:hypothetical protein [Type-E symbiont of Plautia stali]|uniref:hypothetical protein n=1 Tax=Type-E symbiont of Plautia stali TaxID=1560357 RepID=UPI00073EA6D5|nr:hypothetical protein [Type-E symbiont of Plautia stali]